MDNKEFINEYKREFDSVTASDKLRRAVLDLKPQSRKKVITPFKATIGTVAAAVMIFAAVNEYGFEPDTSGVISETVATTQMPDAEFMIVEKKAPTQAPTSGNEQSVRVTAKPTSVPKATQAPTAVPAITQTSQPTPDMAEEGDEHTLTAARIGGGGGVSQMPTTDMWSVDEYYEYLGLNISSRIGARYTGSGQLEFSVTSDGVPVDDTAVLSFITASGASLRITVSKSAWFDASLSGSVAEAGSGFNAYKVSGGVYCNVYAVGATYDEVSAVIAAL